MADPTGGDGGSTSQPVSAQPESAQPDMLQIGGLTVLLVGAGKGRHRQTLRDLEACIGVRATNGGRRGRQVHGGKNASRG